MDAGAGRVPQAQRLIGTARMTEFASVNHALSDAIVKHNARNPERRIVPLNFDGRDPALTVAKVEGKDAVPPVKCTVERPSP